MADSHEEKNGDRRRQVEEEEEEEEGQRIRARPKEWEEERRMFKIITMVCLQ